MMMHQTMLVALLVILPGVVLSGRPKVICKYLHHETKAGDWLSAGTQTCMCGYDGKWKNCKRHCKYGEKYYPHREWLYKPDKAEKCHCRDGLWDCVGSGHCMASGQKFESGEWSSVPEKGVCRCEYNQWVECHQPKSCKKQGKWTEHEEWTDDGVIKCQCWDSKWKKCESLQPSKPTTAEPLPFSTAASRRARFDSEDFVFDLDGSNATSTGAGGEVRPLTVSQLPSLSKEGISLTLVSLDPCGINLPHSHPRATEVIYLIKGSHLRTAFVEENGGRTITNDLSTGQTTFFPQGLIHYQQNLGCKEAVFLASLNNEDPGVVTTAKRLFSLDESALADTFDLEVDTINHIRYNLPSGPAEGRSACLARCNGWYY